MEIAHLIFLTGWTGAGLMWLLDAGSLPKIFANVAPKTWLAGRDRFDIRLMDIEAFTLFLCAESSVPRLMAKHLTCSYCLSASISAVGLAISGFRVPHFGQQFLLWASAAFFAITIRKLSHEKRA